MMLMDDERRWKPRHRRTLIVAPLDGQGFDEHGLFVPEDDRRNRTIGYVLATNACVEIQPDDLIYFEEGAGEELKTASGEVICWLHETKATAVDEDLWPKPKAEEVTASGLVLPGRG